MSTNSDEEYVSEERKQINELLQQLESVKYDFVNIVEKLEEFEECINKKSDLLYYSECGFNIILNELKSGHLIFSYENDKVIDFCKNLLELYGIPIGLTPEEYKNKLCQDK